MKFLDNPEPLDIGEGDEPIAIRLARAGSGYRTGERQYRQGLVLAYHRDVVTGDAIYQLYVFDIPIKSEQVALARKICAVEGAVRVNEGTGLGVDVELLRQALTAEEFRLFRCLTMSREAQGSLMSYINSARLEGEEGYENLTALLDRDEIDNPTAGLGQFSLEGNVTAKQLNEILIQRIYYPAP